MKPPQCEIRPWVVLWCSYPGAWKALVNKYMKFLTDSDAKSVPRELVRAHRQVQALWETSSAMSVVRLGPHKRSWVHTGLPRMELDSGKDQGSARRTAHRATCSSCPEPQLLTMLRAVLSARGSFRTCGGVDALHCFHHSPAPACGSLHVLCSARLTPLIVHPCDREPSYLGFQCQQGLGFAESVLGSSVAKGSSHSLGGVWRFLRGQGMLPLVTLQMGATRSLLRYWIRTITSVNPCFVTIW